jgi:hypothetical protein
MIVRNLTKNNCVLHIFLNLILNFEQLNTAFLICQMYALQPEVVANGYSVCL